MDDSGCPAASWLERGTYQTGTKRVRECVLKRDAKQDDHPAKVVLEVDALGNLAPSNGQKNGSTTPATRCLEVGQGQGGFHNVLRLNKH